MSISDIHLIIENYEEESYWFFDEYIKSKELYDTKEDLRLIDILQHCNLIATTDKNSNIFMRWYRSKYERLQELMNIDTGTIFDKLKNQRFRSTNRTIFNKLKENKNI